jgi:peptide chain release factor 2
MSVGDFWDNRERAREVVGEMSAIKSVINPFLKLEKQAGDFYAIGELAEMDGSILAEADGAWKSLEKDLNNMEMVSFLSGKLDRFNAIFTVRSGAGGTESCDWASILFRMYTHWFQLRGWKTELVDMQPGDEAGIKSGTMMVEGEFAYGYCRCEKGVHRLVRISPFDANKRRHTSFAAVDVIADIDEDIDIVILDADLRVDTFRASGAGGQHVNRTDSAIRLTHLQSGIVVSCQSERSQHKNRATCMRILKAKLYEREEARRHQEMSDEYGEKTDNAWGNQIRSYVMQPYQMVKDLRTGVETSNINSVLDGEIDEFVEAQLRGVKREKGGSNND